MRGMFLLELPGPRIIITVNLKFIADLPGVDPDGMDASELDVGIVGILDIDVGAGQITLGVMINLAIQDLLSIRSPSRSTTVGSIPPHGTSGSAPSRRPPAQPSSALFAAAATS